MILLCTGDQPCTQKRRDHVDIAGRRTRSRSNQEAGLRTCNVSLASSSSWTLSWASSACILHCSISSGLHSRNLSCGHSSGLGGTIPCDKEKKKFETADNPEVIVPIVQLSLWPAAGIAVQAVVCAVPTAGSSFPAVFVRFSNGILV